MGQITRDCPHCGTKMVAFKSFGEHRLPLNSQQYTVGFSCGGCHGGIIGEIRCTASTPHATSGDLDTVGNIQVFQTYPVPVQTQSPRYLPENLDKFYQQAASSLSSGNHDASAMMSRKVLEVAVKALDSAGEGSLYKRIENLAKKNLITNDLKGWAHIIRDDGNTAAHEEEPVTKVFAQELLSFAEMFLMYTFTMPNMIKERRHDEASAES
jgi:HEPN domain-containing protein